MITLPIFKTSAKSVQTTAEVSRKYYVLTDVSVCTHFSEYDVLTALALSFGGRGKAFNEFKVVRYTYYSRII